MSRRPQTRIGIAVTVGLLVVAVIAGVRLAWPRPRLNVLLVTLDTTRADHVGCYGYASASTPTVDALAKDGVVFDSAYATVPMTLPSHAGMLTGLYPPENGLHNNTRGRLGKGFATLAEILGDKGYDTAAFIAAIVLRAQTGLDRGFQTYDDEMAGGERHGDETHLMRNGKMVVDSALKWLEGRQSKPFFCWVHLYDPHAPFEGHAETFGDRFRDQPYDGDIAYADLHVGRLVEHLKQRGLYDNTMIVVVGDHGEGFGEHNELEHGFLLYNSTLRVPLVVHAPGHGKAGHRVPTPVSIVDIFPTVLEAAQVPLPQRVSGVSLVPALRGTPIEPRECYSETDSAYVAFGWAPLRSITTERWKYIHTTRDELFDLQSDPQELQNLAEANPDQLAEMRDRLAALEQGLVEIAESNDHLTAQQRRQLASLGYVAGTKAPQQPEPGQMLPDVKDMIGHYNSEVDARVLLGAGKVDEAIERLQKVIEAAPGFVTARLTLGTALRAKNRMDEATEAYLAALKFNPELPQAHFDLAKHYFSQGKTSEALEQYSKVLELDPSDWMAHFNLATILVGQGKADDARTHFEQGLDAFPDSLIGQFNYGLFLGQQGDLHGAIRHVSRALQLNPRNPQIHYQLGLFLASVGEFEEAAAHFEETLRLNSRYPNAAEQLDRARRKLPPGT